MRSRFVYRPGHPKASPNGFVNVEDLEDFGLPPRALDAPIMAGRFYENTHAVDPEKTDIGSRQRYKEYLRRKDVSHYSDYVETNKKNAEKREAFYKDGGDHRQRRDDVGRAFYEVFDKGRKRR